MSHIENSIFSLPSSITIENVEALTGEIRQLGLASNKTLTLDADALGVITTPGIQLLLALHKTVTQSGGTLLINNATDALTHSFELLGMKPQLMAWSEHHA